MSTGLSTVGADVRAACRARLQTLATAGTIAPVSQWEYQGLAFTPTAGTRWLRERLTPVSDTTWTVGPRRRVEFVYLYRVSLFEPSATPVGSGAGAATPTKTLDAHEGAILALFEPGVTFAAPSGRVVRVRSARAGDDVAEADWTQRPVLLTVAADAVTSS